MILSNAEEVRGLPIIEILIGLAVLSVILAVTLPAPQNLQASEEVREASSLLESAFRRAQTAARYSKTSITLSLKVGGNGTQISYEYPSAQVANTTQKFMDPVLLPNSVLVEGETTEFTYDERGMVDTTGHITLKAQSDSALFSTVMIETRMGYVRSCLSAEMNFVEDIPSCEMLLLAKTSNKECKSVNCALIDHEKRVNGLN